MRRVEHVMGLPVSVRVEGVADGVDRAFAWLREVDERFSPFKPGSEVSRLGRARWRKPR
ncbi:hypothetical protein SUDANB95_06595 [Actinosynnema sp. ALI-1.44]